MLAYKNLKIEIQIQILVPKTQKMPPKTLKCSKKLRKLPK